MILVVECIDGSKTCFSGSCSFEYDTKTDNWLIYDFHNNLLATFSNFKISDRGIGYVY